MSIYGIVPARSLVAAVLMFVGLLFGAGTQAQDRPPIRDCVGCPTMIVVPAGTFDMGAGSEDVQAGEGPSGAIEQGTPQIPLRRGASLPRHRVTIARAFAIGETEVTYGAFAAFVAATRYRQDGNDCLLFDTGSDSNVMRQDLFANWQAVRNSNWQFPPWPTSPDEPVTCVNRDDARAYAAWLGSTTGHRYRLPSEAEWEYAARAGSDAAWSWGNDPAAACRYANVADRSFLRTRVRTATATNHFACDDGYAWNAPVGSYRANAWGLRDTVGNVAEIVEDCWHDDYAGAPSDGSAWTQGDCRFGVVKGDAGFVQLAASHLTARLGVPMQQFRSTQGGFRLVRELDR